MTLLPTMSWVRGRWGALTQHLAWRGRGGSIAHMSRAVLLVLGEGRRVARGHPDSQGPLWVSSVSSVHTMGWHRGRAPRIVARRIDRAPLSFSFLTSRMGKRIVPITWGSRRDQMGQHAARGLTHSRDSINSLSYYKSLQCESKRRDETSVWALFESTG